MLWLVEVEGYGPAYVEVGTGKLFSAEGSVMEGGFSYAPVDTSPTAPGWYQEPSPETPPVNTYGVRWITKLAFRNRFTQAEKVAIEIAALDVPTASMQQRAMSAALRASQQDVQVAQYIDLDRADTRAGVMMLEQAGLLTPAGRALQILDAEIQPSERYQP